MTQTPYCNLYGSTSILDAVEAWSSASFFLRELEIENGSRIDGLIVASYGDTFTKNYRYPGFYAVEVKVSRGDFNRGIVEKQIERYRDLNSINGLFVAVPIQLEVKPSELPEGVGLLICGGRGNANVAVCRRRPTVTDRKSHGAATWRVLKRVLDEHRTIVSRERLRAQEATERFGHMAEAAIMPTIRKAARLIQANVSARAAEEEKT